MAKSTKNMVHHSSFNCYLLEFPNKPIQLFADKEYNFGRDESNEIQINSTFVSRTHTCIYFKNDSFYIKDLGSKNGTFLNSKKITDSILKDGDQIGIGDRIYVYHQKVKNLDLIDLAEEGSARISEKITVSRRGQMSGRFEEYSILELLQYLSTRNRTGSLLIRFEDDSDGLIQFREGHIEHSFYQGLKGEESLQKIVDSKLSQFQFDPMHKTSMISIDRSTTNLFLDIFKNKDSKE